MFIGVAQIKLIKKCSIDYFDNVFSILGFVLHVCRTYNKKRPETETLAGFFMDCLDRIPFDVYR